MIANNIYSLNKITENANCPVVLYITSGRDSDEAKALYKSVNEVTDKVFSLYELRVENWDDYLTPWPMQMGKRAFSGKADMLISAIETEVIPKIRSQIGDSEDIFIAGYSLAGLFSLFAIYESDVFAGAVSCSGSLWYKDWVEYISNHEIKRDAKVYLSLGDKEKNSRNSFMKTVEDNTNYQKDIFKKSDKVKSVLFEMNSGGHFADVYLRMAKGIRYIIEN